jgi:TonB-dependent starch-binding outer membrane protein SusC
MGKLYYNNKQVNAKSMERLGIKAASFLLLLITLLPFGALKAQDTNLRRVTGKIMDISTGEPLPGANVVIKGTSTGAVTDFDGNYQIMASNRDILVYSFIGYSPEEEVVGTRSVIDVRMAPDFKSLSEVVIVGYGTVEQKDITGSVAKITSKDFNKGVMASPDRLLNGKVAGLQITDNGEPGGGMGIRLRGSSLNGETPLFVVDGVPLEPGGVTGGRNPLNFINPADVADITVLKDASAAAIYGSRGANGVIIITTKQGETGKPKFSYDAFYSLAVPIRQIDMLSPTQFRAAVNLKAPQALNFLGQENTNWMDEVTRVAQSMQHNFTASGGVKKTRYHASVSYLENQGVLRFTENKTLNLGLRVNQSLFDDRLKITAGTRTGFTNDLYGPNVIGTAARFDPTRPVRADGFEQWGGFYQQGVSPFDPLSPGNPVASQEQQVNTGQTFRSLNSANLIFKVPYVDGLTLNANLSYDYNRGTFNGMTPPNSKDAFQIGGVIREELNVRTSEVYEYFGNYKKKFGNHGIDIVGGYSYQNSRSEYDREVFRDLILGDDGNFTSLTELEPAFNRIDENRLISFFGRVNYDYKDKYLLTLSMRRDGSSRFGLNNRWGLFPAAAFAWRVLDEDFALPLSNVFSDLKVRAGWGVTGNQEIGNYLFNVYYRLSEETASYQFGDEFVQTLRPSGVDPDIKWEETISTNIGLDMGFWGGRVNTSIDLYDKRVNDLLFSVAVPAGSNLSDRVLTNIGRVRNYGVEMMTNVVVMSRSDLRWDISFNAAYNRNEILKLDNLTGEALADFIGYEVGGIQGDVGQQIQILRVGHPLFSFFHYQGRRDANGNLIVDENGDGVQRLIEIYEDQNGDGIINENDKIVGQQPAPVLLMGLTSNLSYKKWDVSFTLRSAMGNYVYNNTASALGFYQLITDRFNVNNPVLFNIHRSAFTTDFNERQLHHDFYVENASYLKLDNITFGYTFDNVRFRSLRVYTTVQNAFFLTGYSGVDPEIFNGIDNNLYPRATTFLVGLNANF